MGLTTGGNKDPFIISKCKIANSENVSGEPQPFNKDEKIEIGVKLTFDIGKSFQPTLMVTGRFKRDEASLAILDWGRAFKVRNLLEILAPEYVDQLASTYQIPPEAVAAMRGKEIYRLSYIAGRNTLTGKLKYYDWDEVGAIEKGEEYLKDRFLRSNKAGYPKNFRPETLTEDASFPAVGGL